MGIDSTNAISNDPAVRFTSEQSPCDTPPAVVVPASPAPRPSNALLQGLSAIMHGATPQRAPVDTPSSGNGERSKAFEAQRLDISAQAGPSDNPHLTALDVLQKRDFKPAPGGVEIPFTTNSLLGGGKRVYTHGASSHDVQLVHAGAEPGLREAIEDKQLLIQDLIQDLEDESEEGQRALTIEALNQARAALADLARRYAISREQNRNVNG
ncbi:hypothetical protein ACFX58_10260 [Sphingomonas sp. NCPPB 2930]